MKKDKLLRHQEHRQTIQHGSLNEPQTNSHRCENKMTDEQINARIAELRAKPILKATEAETRELLSYYADDQLHEIQVILRGHIKSIARKKKHFAEYWRCKDILK